MRRWIAATGCVLALMFAACGSDDEAEAPATQPAATETEAETTATEEARTGPETETAPATSPPEDRPETAPEEQPPATSPEDQPGGAGDEEPARSLALFTGRGARITPRVIRVPAFISIRVELRSADGRGYGLELDGETIRVSRGLNSVSTTIDGLRPGRAVTGNPIGAGNRVRIEATAEPGP